MQRYKIGHDALGLFVGPAPASGYHFVTDQGVFNNNPGAAHNINLVSPLNRIQNISYDISAPRTDLKALGRLGNLSREFQDKPTVNLNFDYVPMGVINEAKMGFYVNYPKIQSNPESIFPDNDAVFLFEGFNTRELTRENVAIGYPFAYRDCRNIFLAISTNEGHDFNKTGFVPYDEMNVVAFGNCYIESFKARAAVGDFPLNSVSYVCDNIGYYASGSGISIPAINTKTYEQYSGTYCSISNNMPAETVSVLLPGDIQLDIKSWNKATGIHAFYGTGYNATVENSQVDNLGIDFSNISIEGYDIGINFTRTPLKSLTHRLPLDRKISWPAYASLAFDITENKYLSGSLQSLVNRDEEYYISIKLNNPTCPAIPQGVGVQYNFKRAKFAGVSHQENVGAFSRANLSFVAELDPNDLSKGLMISGLLNIDTTITESLLLAEEGDFITTEEGEFVIVSDQFSLFQIGSS